MGLAGQEVFYMALGLLSVAALFRCNAHLYKRGWTGAGVSRIELVYYLVALAGLLIGWYFNLQYLSTYREQSGWWHWTTLLFVNPASASGGQDLIIANMILFPLWTLVDGRRRGMKAVWLYFPMSLLTSYAFGVALFLAIQERQIRWNSLHGTTRPSPVGRSRA